MSRPAFAVDRRAAFAVCCAALIAACTAMPSNKAPARLALVIGNADYRNAPPLRNPVNDAEDMCKALRDVGFETLCHTNLRDRAEFPFVTNRRRFGGERGAAETGGQTRRERIDDAEARIARQIRGRGG